MHVKSEFSLQSELDFLFPRNSVKVKSCAGQSLPMTINP
jgi:hypothetical protein